MWRNWESCALPVGMENGAAAVENAMEVPQKMKCDQAMPFLGLSLPKRTERRAFQRYLCTHIHSSILFTISKK